MKRISLTNTLLIQKITNKQLKWDNLKIIGPLESMFESDDNTIFVLMKKNKHIKVDKSIIFPNHIYSSKNNFSNKFQKYYLLSFRFKKYN